VLHAAQSSHSVLKLALARAMLLNGSSSWRMTCMREV
jgi:hypothetical protein